MRKNSPGFVLTLVHPLLNPGRSVGVACLAVFLGLLSASAASGQTHASLPSNPSALFAALSEKADAARDAERLDEAVSLYRRALALRPSWAEGWWSLGTIYYDRDDYANGAIAFQKVTALQAGNGTAQAMLGLCEFELGHDEAALRYIQKGKNLGLQKNPDLWHVVLYHEGVLLQRKGSFQAAQDTLEELCLQAGLSEKAATILGMTMLRIDAKEPPAPESPDGQVVQRVGRAECLAGQKKYDEARAGFEEVVKDNPEYPNIHYAYGLLQIELRDVAGAVEQFKLEIKNHPEDVIARLRIAAAQYKEDSASAIPYAEEAVKLAPRQPFGHYLLGLLRLDVDDYLNAIPELEIARKGMPQEAKIYLALGTAYSRAGRRQDAAQARATFARLSAEAKKSGRIESAPGETGNLGISVREPASSPQ